MANNWDVIKTIFFTCSVHKIKRVFVAVTEKINWFQHTKTNWIRSNLVASNPTIKYTKIPFFLISCFTNQDHKVSSSFKFKSPCCCRTRDRGSIAYQERFDIHECSSQDEALKGHRIPAAAQAEGTRSAEGDAGEAVVGSWLLLGTSRTRGVEADSGDEDHLRLPSSFRLRSYFLVIIVGFRAFCVVWFGFGVWSFGCWKLELPS